MLSGFGGYHSLGSVLERIEIWERYGVHVAAEPRDDERLKLPVSGSCRD